MEQQPQSQNPGGSSGGSGLAPNVASLLCYLCGWLTGLIFLLIEKDKPDIKFHAWQSIAMDVAVIALYIGLSILGFILMQIAGPLAFIVWLLDLVLWIGYIALKIICMVKAYQGQKFKLPYIGDFAEKQAGK